MKIGITGTRYGMNKRQYDIVRRLLDEINYRCRARDIKPEFHHGDCIGVDIQAAEIARVLGYTTVAHPGRSANPAAEDLRANHSSDVIWDTETYFKRNRQIVFCVDYLIVVPKENTPNKGGSWYTYSYALTHGKKLKVVYPDV